jgi:catechol 2,3-dioxygenase-like lactoylglutathione lyase family enzyme
MGVRLTEIVIDCADPEALAAWWQGVLGWERGEDTDVTAEDVEVEVEVEVELRNPGGYPHLLFGKVPEAKAGKNRLHLDLSPTGGDQAEALERLRALGATEIDIGQGEQTWVVLADPEGNEFCLLRTRRE